MNNIPYDIHYTIMLNANYKKTLLLLKTCHNFNNIPNNVPNIWMLKCNYQYPDKPYFDFWTGQENFLVKQQKEFLLAFNFSLDKVDNYLFEWNPILPHMLHLSDEITDTANGYTLYGFVRFTVQYQFILIKQDERLNNSIIGQFSTNDDAKQAMQNDQLTIQPNFIHIVAYVIVDLQHTVPYFTKYGVLNPQNKIQPGKFYNY